MRNCVGAGIRFKGRMNSRGDEFYTRRVDIDKCLPLYDFSQKIVYCPCDGEHSEFVKYFQQEGKCKKLIYTSDDFNNHADLFEQCDIVITNPPFSCWVNMLDNYILPNKKDYLLILPTVTITVFMKRDTPIYLYGVMRKFLTKNGELSHDITCKWFGSIRNDKCIDICDNHKCNYTGKYEIELFEGKEYRYYKYADLPKEVEGEFLVPITYDEGYKKYFPNLEIVKYAPNVYDKVSGKKCFARLLAKLM